MINEKSREKQSFINCMISYFASGEKPDKNMCTGMELEHFVIEPCGFTDAKHLSGNKCRPVYYEGNKGVEAILEAVSDKFDTKTFSEGRLIGLAGTDYTITLEPSAQIEISIAPQKELFRTSLIYSTFKRTIGPVLDRFALKLANYGYSPSSKACNSPMIPKKRYEYMDRFFGTSGTMGINMMRSTAATQISIDYADEKDFVRKYRAAYVLSPVLKYICDNTPVFESEANPEPLKRTEIWHNVDESRCRMPDNLFDEAFGYEAYAEYLWQTPAIYVPGKPDNPDRLQDFYVGSTTMGELWMAGTIDESDIEFILSMVFPDVRLKNFIEIRYADSLPFNEALGYMAMLKGLMYNREAVDWTLSQNIGREDILKAERDISAQANQAQYMGYQIDELTDKLFDFAANGLGEDEKEFLVPLKTRRFETEVLL